MYLQYFTRQTNFNSWVTQHSPRKKDKSITEAKISSLYLVFFTYTLPDILVSLSIAVSISLRRIQLFIVLSFLKLFWHFNESIRVQGVSDHPFTIFFSKTRKIELLGPKLSNLNQPQDINENIFSPPPLNSILGVWGEGPPHYSGFSNRNGMFWPRNKKQRWKLKTFCLGNFFRNPHFFKLRGILGDFQLAAVGPHIIRVQKLKIILIVRTNTFLLMWHLTIFDPKLQGPLNPQNFGASKNLNSKISNRRVFFCHQILIFCKKAVQIDVS